MSDKSIMVRRVRQFVHVYVVVCDFERIYFIIFMSFLLQSLDYFSSF